MSLRPSIHIIGRRAYRSVHPLGMVVPEPPTQHQLRIKAWTAVATAAAMATLLLYDWDAATGHKNIFSGIRPAVRSALNRVYGVDPPAPVASKAQGSAGRDGPN